METLNDNPDSISIDTDASKYVNDPNIEYHWAVKAYQHAEVYYNILCSLETSYLKLTKIDQIIYDDFRKEFPDVNVKDLDVDQLKSAENKEKWRPFCENYKDRVEDYNMGTLLRISAASDYCEENTTLVPRIQFYAIEIARNREGYNSHIRDAFKKQAQLINKTE